LQRIAFGLLYGPGARVYDRFTAWLFLGEWAAWQEAALPLLPSTGPILELGAGTGRLAAVAAAAGRSWVALDRSPAMVRVARRRVRPDGPWLVQADAARLPFADATFAAVVATCPANYVRDAQVAAEVARVLKADGTFVIVLSGEVAPDGWHRRLRRYALRYFYGDGTGADVPELPMPGFASRRETARTAHGTVQIQICWKVGRHDGRP